jgi:inhibitor of KinA
MAAGLFTEPLFRISGDRMLLVAFGDIIDLRVNEKVRAMTALLHKTPPDGVEFVLPSYASLALVYDPLVTGPQALQETVRGLVTRLDDADVPVPSTVNIPVCYAGEFGPDIQFVADYHGLSVQEVIAIHSARPYHIYAIGFAPGFCYLGGLDKRLHTPRLETPRTKVAAGSVGIAEAQTGVYPLNSPGGWRLIGRTPLKIFDAKRERPFLYQAGDNLRFVAISEEEYSRFTEEGGL